VIGHPGATRDDVGRAGGRVVRAWVAVEAKQNPITLAGGARPGEIAIHTATLQRECAAQTGPARPAPRAVGCAGGLGVIMGRWLRSMT
jgi:hypothetical protein